MLKPPPPVVSDLMLPYRLDKYTDKVSSHCVVGSANGIACVAVTIYDNKYKVVPLETDIYFWNPLTRQSKFIRCFKNKNISAAGFGYDSVTGDYKVLVFVFGGGEADAPHFEVYSHNNHTWSNVHPFLSIPLKFEVCFRGYLLDIYRGTMNAIAVFNLHSDVLIFPIELPVLDQGDPHTRDVLNSAVELPRLNPVPGPSFLYDLDFHITEFQNSCALIMHEGPLQKIILWTLDDDSCFRLADIEARWTPLFSVHLGMPAVVYSGFFGNGRLQVAARRIGTDEFWISCDVDKKEAKLRLVDFDGLASRVCMHVDSLVSLDGFSRVDD